MNRKDLLRALKTTEEKLGGMLRASNWGDIEEFNDDHVEILKQVLELRKTESTWKRCFERLNGEKLPVDLIHEAAANDVKKAGDVLKTLSAKSQAELARAYQYFWTQEFRALLESGALTDIADVREDESLGESWLDIAKRRPLILRADNQKSLPSSDSKS